MRKSFHTGFFNGVADSNAFTSGGRRMLQGLTSQDGVFASDNVITFSRNLGFLNDHALIEAWERHAQEAHEKAILWRTAVLLWAARNGLRLDGDFVECGVYRGTTAHILIDAAKITRKFYLYDTFETAERHLPALGPDLEPFVRTRFSGYRNVVITKGRVPETLIDAPNKIAFMHIDMNSATAEIGALEVLFDRMTPGGVVVLDDFGWSNYRRQFDAETEWFSKRGYFVLELPTGQGIVIK